MQEEEEERQEPVSEVVVALLEVEWHNETAIQMEKQRREQPLLDVWVISVIVMSDLRLKPHLHRQLHLRAEEIQSRVQVVVHLPFFASHPMVPLLQQNQPNVLFL